MGVLIILQSVIVFKYIRVIRLLRVIFFSLLSVYIDSELKIFIPFLFVVLKMPTVHGQSLYVLSSVIVCVEQEDNYS